MNKQQLIEKYIRDLVASCSLSEGDRVFSIREMAKMQRTSITPVIAAYQHLEMMGVLESRPKSGYFIAKKAPQKIERILPPYTVLFNIDDDKQSRLYDRVSLLVRDPNIKYSFAPIQIPTSLTDYQKLSYFLTKAISSAPSDKNSFSYKKDNEYLLFAISQWMERCKLQIPDSEICVTTGTAQCLNYALHACLTRNDAVAIECPGNSHYFFAAKLYGIEIVPVRSDPVSGLDIDHFCEQVENNPRIRCLICAPNFSNPTGALMPLSHKQRLAAFCETKDIAIIEDDTSAEHCFDMLPPTPIKSICPDHVIYISGFENTLAHMCYISGGKYHYKIRGFAELGQAYVPKTTQLAFAMYLQSGNASKYAKNVQKQLKNAVGDVYRAIKESFPDGTQINLPKGGRFLWVELPEGCDSMELLEEAAKLSISFSPGPIFSEGLSFVNCLRINCAAVAQDAASLNGIYLLGELAKKMIS